MQKVFKNAEDLFAGTHFQNVNLLFFYYEVVPRNLIFAHGSAIVDIACALDACFEKPNIVSLSSDG